FILNLPHDSQTAEFSASALPKTCGLALFRALEDATDLGSHDEIVLVKSFDLLRAQRDSRVAPAEIDVRMMALRLGKFADAVHEVQRLAKIAKSEASLDAMGIVEKLPLRSLGVEPFRFLSRQWRDATPAGGAGFLDKSFRHGLVSFVAGHCSRDARLRSREIRLRLREV